MRSLFVGVARMWWLIGSAAVDAVHRGGLQVVLRSIVGVA